MYARICLLPFWLKRLCYSRLPLSLSLSASPFSSPSHNAAYILHEESMLQDAKVELGKGLADELLGAAAQVGGGREEALETTLGYEVRKAQPIAH